MVDNEQGDLVPQLVKSFEEFLGDGGRKALERLVKQQHPHVAGERTRNRHHLLLAAGQKIGRHVPALGKSREKGDDTVVLPMNTRAGKSLEAAEREIVGHRHAGEQATSLRHIANATAGDLG